LPRSTTAHFTEHWQRSVGDEGFLEQIVERWRSSDISAGSEEPTSHVADSMPFETYAAPDPRRQEPPAVRSPVAPAAEPPQRQPAIRQAVFRKEASSGGGQGGAVASGDQNVPGTALKTLRDRLIQRQR